MLDLGTAAVNLRLFLNTCYASSCRSRVLTLASKSLNSWVLHHIWKPNAKEEFEVSMGYIVNSRLGRVSVGRECSSEAAYSPGMPRVQGSVTNSTK